MDDPHALGGWGARNGSAPVRWRDPDGAPLLYRRLPAVPNLRFKKQELFCFKLSRLWCLFCLDTHFRWRNTAGNNGAVSSKQILRNDW